MKFLLNIALQWFLGLFGMSDAQKLGRTEIKLADDDAIIKGVQDAKKIDDIVSNQPDGAANDWLHRPRS